ncbi:MAG: TetR/AcrR family transcriptional regulator [Hyphomicrobiaceae bacterium]
MASTPRSRGRPRSETTRRAILDAALELAEREPYGDVTVDRIALAAKVGKQSIYRWWTSKADVILEAFAECQPGEPPPMTGADDAIVALELTLQSLSARTTTPAAARVMRGLLAEAQLDDVLRQKLDQRLLAPWRAMLAAILAQGQARGEVRADVDMAAAIDLILGGLWIRLLAVAPAEGAQPPIAPIIQMLRPALVPADRARATRPDGGVFEA